MYEIKKINGLYRVLTVSNQRIVFSSACRLNCRDYLAENGPKPDKPKPQPYRIEEDRKFGAFDVFQDNRHKGTFPSLETAERFITAQ